MNQKLTCIEDLTEAVGSNVVSRYTDGEAVEDGVLVALGPRDRITRTLLDELCRVAEANKLPSELIPHLAAAVVDAYGDDARIEYDRGGIYKFDTETLAGAPNSTAWILPNELGGCTFMLPADY